MKYSTRVRNYLWNHNSPLAPSRLHQLSDALLLPASCNNMTVMSTGTRRSIENHECRKSGAKRNCIIMQKNQNIYMCFVVSVCLQLISHKLRQLGEVAARTEWAGGRAEPEFLPHFSHVTHRKHKLTLTCCLDIVLSYCIQMCQRPASLPLLLRCGHQHITII